MTSPIDSKPKSSAFKIPNWTPSENAKAAFKVATSVALILSTRSRWKVPDTRELLIKRGPTGFIRKITVPPSPADPTVRLPYFCNSAVFRLPFQRVDVISLQSHYCDVKVYPQSSVAPFPNCPIKMEIKPASHDEKWESFTRHLMKDPKTFKERAEAIVQAKVLALTTGKNPEEIFVNRIKFKNSSEEKHIGDARVLHPSIVVNLNHILEPMGLSIISTWIRPEDLRGLNHPTLLKPTIKADPPSPVLTGNVC